MQQLTYAGPDALEWREAPEPRLSSDRAALVRPLAVATCDLDALIIAGSSPFAAPFPLGHECVAEVLDVGDSVASLEPGGLVSVPFQISCGECAPCRRGRSGNCASVPFMSTYGFGPAVEQWGGFLSDLVCVPYAEHMLVPVPDGLEPEVVASASDNLSDAWRAVAPALAEEPGAAVLVVGGAAAGSIGLYAVALALALGAGSVLYVDGDERRRQIAATLGADALAETPKRLGPFPVTVDAGADPDGLALALRSTAPDGTCTSTAIYFGEQPSLPLLEMYTKGVTFKTGRVHAREAMPQVLELAAAGRVHPELVTSRVVGWTEAREALLERDWTKLVIARGKRAAVTEAVTEVVTIDELTIADEPERWTAASFAVRDSCCQLGSVRLRLAGPQRGAGAGILAWSLRGIASVELDGLPTSVSESPPPPPPPAHPNGVIAIDHVVVMSPALDRTVAALQAAGLDLRRVREQPTPAGAPRQAFFRLGEEILEVVQEPEAVLARDGGRERPARLWGLALRVQDLDRTLAALGPHASPARPAVQPGRRIATVRRSAGLAVPVALMSPPGE